MFQKAFIEFLDQENMGLDIKIVIIHEVMPEISKIKDFMVAILKNGRHLAQHVFFQSGSIANIVTYIIVKTHAKFHACT